MRRMSFDQAIEDAIIQAMLEDDRVFIMGEDVHTNRTNIMSRFSDRVIPTPISESAFLGTGVAAAMAGLRPIVELWMIDFVCVAYDALVNHAAKIYDFSGKKWSVPLVIRASCGAGIGDGGQHGQMLYGSIASIPGLKIVVPSNPSDAGRLILSAIQDNNTVIFLEHKLLSDHLLHYLGGSGRDTLEFNIPPDGIEGEVPDKWEPLELGKLNILKEGNDITLASLGVSVHRCMEAAREIEKEGISVEVLDLRSVVPLDIDGIFKSVEKTGKLLVVDEDYKQFGLSGEIAALLLEKGLKFEYGRVATEGTIPFSRILEDETLPNVERIRTQCKILLKK